MRNQLTQITQGQLTSTERDLANKSVLENVSAKINVRELKAKMDNVDSKGQITLQD